MNSIQRKLYTIFFVSTILLSATIFLSVGTSAVNASPFVDEKVDTELAARLATLPLDALSEVVIVFSDLSAAPRVQALTSTFYQMRALPMAGTILTRTQIEQLATWPEIYSITGNEPLEYFMHESVQVIHADQVWTKYGQTGGNPLVSVAILDSGIDASHPDLLLGSKVIQNVKLLPFTDPLEDQLNTDTTSGHGTHVAGTVGGSGFMSEGYYRGVAPDVKLVGLGSGEGINILFAIEGYDWILENHATYNIRIVSNSWGSTGGTISIRNPIIMATFEAYKLGVLTVFAAGNDGGYDVMNPYSLPPWILSVAAGKKDGSLAEFSSRGKDGDYFKHPDITAPGVDIFSARSKTGAATFDGVINPVNPVWTASYSVLSGTSMATPHVSGAAALLFSSNPELSPDEVMDLLTAEAVPMSGLLLHEAGYGYMDVLASYESSRSLPGNMDSFLAGQRLHGIDEVLGFNPDDGVVFNELVFSCIAVGVVGVGDCFEHTFTVTAEVLFVDIRVTWTPQENDAWDIEVSDPQGRLVASSGNFVGQPEAVLFVPDVTGTYTLEVIPFANVASEYEARIRLASGAKPDWPPTGTPLHDYYVGVDGVFKLVGVLGIGAVGIRSDFYRSGDSGFMVFTFSAADGTPLTGQAANLQALYLDRNGNAAFVDNAIRARSTAGEYQSTFNINNNWQGAAGLLTIRIVWKQAGTVRALPTLISHNHLQTTLETDALSYNPGDTVSFTGTVAQLNTVATSDVETTPLTGSQVSVRLVDSNGNTLATAQSSTDLEGEYSGSLIPPETTRGPTTLIAEATYNDPTIAIGPKGWYGKAEVSLQFPGNLPPKTSLFATPQTGPQQKFIISISASVSDPDGATDITTISLVLTDSKGRVLKQWSLADFTQTDADTWSIETAYKVSGKAPWTLSLVAVDSTGHTATAAAVITKSS
jgi:serine protease AprX